MHIVTHQSLLLIGRTGIGKSHFVRMVGTVLGGIVVVVVGMASISLTKPLYVMTSYNI